MRKHNPSLYKIKKTHNLSLRRITSLPKMHHLSFASGLSRLNTHTIESKNALIVVQVFAPWWSEVSALTAYAASLSMCCVGCDLSRKCVFRQFFLPFPQFPPSLVLCNHFLLHCSLLCLLWKRKSTFNMRDCLDLGDREVSHPQHERVCVCVTIRKTYEGCNTAAV